jgi:putative NADH-flavin reductase
MMKLALIGATGNVGSRLLAEALHRGHSVTAIVRQPGKLAPQPDLTERIGDVRKPDALAEALRGHDAVISSVRFVDSDEPSLVAAVKKSGVSRLLVVGGAGSLEVAPGVALIDTPQFPAAYKVEASAGRDFLNALRRETELNWTFLSPSALFVPGERTGRFRVGGDQLLKDKDGKSWISMEDYAIAMLDEVETPKHPRQRFTVGY